MACLFMVMFSSSSIVKLAKKMSIYSAYSNKILVKALFCYRVTSKRAPKRSIVGFKAFKVTICTTNILKFLFRVALANLYLLINFTHLAMLKVSAAM